jgi:hypothetical protein
MERVNAVNLNRKSEIIVIAIMLHCFCWTAPNFATTSVLSDEGANIS